MLTNQQRQDLQRAARYLASNNDEESSIDADEADRIAGVLMALAADPPQPAGHAMRGLADYLRGMSRTARMSVITRDTLRQWADEVEAARRSAAAPEPDVTKVHKPCARHRNQPFTFIGYSTPAVEVCMQCEHEAAHGGEERNG